ALEVSMGGPSITEGDVEEVTRVLRSGRLREGPLCRKFEEEFASKVGSKFAVSLSSGTAALQVAYLILLKPGDEVLVPSFTFIATASMVALSGATPVFCDVDAKTFTLDLGDARKRITSRTRAIAPVHLFGNCCDIPGVRAMAGRNNLRIVWDAAQAHGARSGGADVGSFGDLVCYSFYASKNMTTGEGGMITTSDPEIFEKCARMRDHGQTGANLHTSLGFNYRMTDMQAALGLSQLKRLDSLVGRRRENAGFLDEGLREVEGITPPHVPDGVEHSYNQYSILLAGEQAKERREEFRDQLRERGIETAVYYSRPLHLQPVFAERPQPHLPVSEDLSDRIVSLPVHPGLRAEDLRRITGAVREEMPVKL
ncbi:MAG: DegT/DnrJ/EryC1/StrS family aminotransferase, partial [Acidobacteriota bacterium]